MEIISACKDRVLGAVQSRQPLPPIQNVEEGISRIEHILQRKLLCRHEIEDINGAYKNIELLEGRVDQTCQLALGKIVDKVANIVAHRPVGAEDLASLYHLRTALARDLRKAPSFKNALREIDKHPDRIEEVSVDRPDCCPSMNLEVVTRFFNQKREKFLKREQMLQELTQLRRGNPLNYPLYLDELLDKGYFRLYEQILQMRELPSRNARRVVIEQGSFSQISHVVLETRDAIIKKVEASIPEGQNKIVFLLGGSGAGKSTTLCFLRKDKMVLGTDFTYSSVDGRSGLIGHEGDRSCTFLPTVEMVGDMAIVDFPGFEDTHGPIIAMGMELALKALLKKFSPKVLVLESITNTEGRYAAAAQLGLRLDRLLDNRSSCILGITKYSKDPNFGRLKAIEEQQKKELLTPNVEEITLKAQIDVLKTVNSPDVLPIIQMSQKRLTEIQKERKEKLSQPLPDTEEKIEFRNTIRQTEQDLARQIGLRTVIRFDDLEEERTLSSCLSILSEHQEAVCVRNAQVLDPLDQALLWNRFENNLVTEMVAKRDHHSDFEDVESFEQSVLESSLIKTIFAITNPEIGQFLHLPEMDPQIVRGYDRHIVRNCIKEYMKIVIEKFNMSFINIILKELGEKGGKNDVAALEKSWARLRDFILGLEGVIPEDPAQAAEKWNEIQKKHRESASAQLTWAESIASLGLFYPAFLWVKRKVADWIEAGIMIMECRNDIDQIYHSLLRLKGIEKIIEKQDEIDRAFNSVNISTESKVALEGSIRTKINNVRKVYGEEEWDKRVAFLSEQFILKNFYPDNSSHPTCVLAYAYWLIESDLTPVYHLPQREKIKKENSGLESKPLSLRIVGLPIRLASEVGLQFGKMLNLFMPEKVEEFVLALPKAEAFVREEPVPLLFEGEFEQLQEFAIAISKKLKVMIDEEVVGGLQEVEEADVAVQENEVVQWTNTYQWLRELLDGWENLKESQEGLKKIRVLLWALVEAQKTGLEWSDRKLFIASFRRESATAMEVFGSGKRPKLAKGAPQAGNIPLEKALSAAALLKWYDKDLSRVRY